MESNLTLQIVLAIAGSVALLIGLFGGGVKAKEIEIPKIRVGPRILSSLVGVALIGISIGLPYFAPPAVSTPVSTEPPAPPAVSEIPPPAAVPTDPPVTEPPGIPPETAFPATAVMTLTPLPKDFSDNSSPSAVMAGDRLTVFARSADGTLMHKFYDGGWTDWLPLGEGQMTSGPSAVMAGERLTVFARSEDGTLTHKYYDGGWTDWLPLGEGKMTSNPSAVMAGERLTVFARSANGTLTL
jgi:hypothetical protein